MKKYCECGTFVADIKEGSKLQKGMTFRCNKCTVNSKLFGEPESDLLNKIAKSFSGGKHERYI